MVVTAVEYDPAEMNYPELQENLALLRSAKDQAGEPLRVETLPMPRAVMFEGQRLPASYANFYIANKIVLVPTFNDPADRVALNTLAASSLPRVCPHLLQGFGFRAGDDSLHDAAVSARLKFVSAYTRGAETPGTVASSAEAPHLKSKRVTSAVSRRPRRRGKGKRRARLRSGNDGRQEARVRSRMFVNAGSTSGQARTANSGSKLPHST